MTRIGLLVTILAAALGYGCGYLVYLAASSDAWMPLMIVITLAVVLMACGIAVVWPHAKDGRR